jgi:outer membrane receptor protein involved in Fe transport
MKTPLLTTTCLMALFVPATLHAQTAPSTTPADAPVDASQPPQAAPSAPADAKTTDTTGTPEIVVTGSRIARRDYVSDSPIITRSADQIKNSGSVNLESVLNRLPQFVPGQGAYTPGQGGRATLNLRGLGEQRNLILLDGRRLPPATPLGVVNINIIPQGILSGIETISGGASATYGSDAISGVVNFKSLQSFNGVQIDIQKGITDRGDVPQTNVNLVAGMSSADGDSHALISVGYYDRARFYGLSRPFYIRGAPSSTIFGGTYVPAGTNLPTQAAVSSVFAKYGITSGVSNTTPFGFNDNGTLYGQQGSANYVPLSTPYMFIINNNVSSSSTSQTDAASGETRYSIFAKFDHKVSSGVKIYAQGLFVDDDVALSAGYVPSLLVSPIIPVTNPYIPADLRTILASRPNPTAPFNYSRRFDNLPQRVIDDRSTTWQILVGAGGKLGAGDLTWDIYGSKSETRLVETFQHAILLSRLNNLLGAADGGNSICTGGFNPFGVAAGSTISNACADYLSTQTHAVTSVKQDIVEAQVGGTLLRFNGNDVKFNISANYRKDTYSFSPDASIVNKDVLSAIVAPTAGGSRNVKEIAGELSVPLLRERPFFQLLELDLGYRYSDYAISGGVSTYKASGIWKPASMLLLRGGYEHAIRAPGLAELFASATGGLAQFGTPPNAGDPCDSRSVARTGANAANLRGLCIATGVPVGIVDTFQYTTNAIIGASSGSKLLKPETADTLTLGAVFRPQSKSPLLSNLSFSVDYYNIRLKDAISSIAPGTVVNKCYNLDGSNSTYSASNFYCGFINRDASGGIALVSTPYVNLGGINTSGIDFQFDWSTGLGVNDRLGHIALNATVSWLQHYKVSQLPGNPFLEFKNTIDSTPATGLVLPNWRSQATLIYSIKPVDVGLTWIHIPGMRDVSSVTRPASPSAGVTSYDRLDLRIAFSIGDRYQLSFNVNNLTDRTPLIVAGTPGLTQPGSYDIYGRSYLMSLRAKF